MRAVRLATAAGVAAYGASYLWLAPAAIPGAGGGPLWAAVEVLVIVTVAGFMVAAWGLAAATPWGRRLTAAAAVAGLITLAVYLVAMRDVRVGGAEAGGALRAIGAAAVLLTAVIPAAERSLARRG